MSERPRSDLTTRLRVLDSLLTAVDDGLTSFKRLLAEIHAEISQLRHEEEEQSRDEEIQALRREVEQLREGLTSRAVIERAKGVLMQSNGVTADEAFDLLNEMSQRRHRKLRDVAAEVANGVPGTRLATGQAPSTALPRARAGEGGAETGPRLVSADASATRPGPSGLTT